MHLGSRSGWELKGVPSSLGVRGHIPNIALPRAKYHHWRGSINNILIKSLNSAGFICLPLSNYFPYRKKWTWISIVGDVGSGSLCHGPKCSISCSDFLHPSSPDSWAFYPIPVSFVAATDASKLLSFLPRREISKMLLYSTETVGGDVVNDNNWEQLLLPGGKILRFWQGKSCQLFLEWNC